MKVTPLAIWCHKLTPDEVIEAVPCDVNFIHSVRSVSVLITCYVLAIKYLMNHPEDADRRQKAFEAAYAHAQSADTVV